NYIVHRAVTGPALEAVFRAVKGDSRLEARAFVCASGSGGTLAGIAMALKDFNAGITIGCADPMGAAMYSWFTHGELKSSGSSITEG
ncbi:hypothetical protein, partial [Streptococcus pneumoniae]|uniref:hypothetical protein n=1 Tax=Streptococcus pneumoniae TaxID=1313 RepID=UPI003D663565